MCCTTISPVPALRSLLTLCRTTWAFQLVCYGLRSQTKIATLLGHELPLLTGSFYRMLTARWSLTLRRMTMASPKPRDMQVAMGRAVYGTPQMMSYSQPRTAFHIMRDTCIAVRAPVRLSSQLLGEACLKVVAGSLQLASSAQSPNKTHLGLHPHPLCCSHLLQNVWVADDDAQVHVHWGQQPALKLELAELDSLHNDVII